MPSVEFQNYKYIFNPKTYTTDFIVLVYKILRRQMTDLAGTPFADTLNEQVHFRCAIAFRKFDQGYFDV